MGVVGGLVGHDGAGGGLCAIASGAQLMQPRIAGPAFAVRRRRLPGGEHGRIVGLDLDLGAEAIEHQSLDQGLSPVGGDIDQAAVVPAEQEQVEKHLALGRQQSAEPQFAQAQRLHVLGDQALQEAAPIRAGHRNQGAAFQGSDQRGQGHPQHVAPPSLERQHLPAYR